jgi:hypothetical protein
MYKTQMYDLWEDDNFYIKCQMINDKPFIHLKVFNWSHNLYKELKQIWRQILKEFCIFGYESVFIVIPDDDPKMYKFETKFGFKELQREGNQILMVCEVNYGN